MFISTFRNLIVWRFYLLCLNISGFVYYGCEFFDFTWNMSLLIIISITFDLLYTASSFVVRHASSSICNQLFCSSTGFGLPDVPWSPALLFPACYSLVCWSRLLAASGFLPRVVVWLLEHLAELCFSATASPSTPGLIFWLILLFHLLVDCFSVKFFSYSFYKCSEWILLC